MGTWTDISIIVFIVVLVILGLFLVLLYSVLNGVLFYPLKDTGWKPEIPYRDVMVDNRISSWYFNNHPKNKTILFCHGNTGNISHRDYIINLCDRQKLNLIVFDYRGFGKSEGISTQTGICEDGESVYRYLISEGVDPDNIIVWGESLGGAVATYISSRHRSACLILMATFSSLDDVIRDHADIVDCGYYYLKTLSSILPWITDNLPSKNRLMEVKSPILIIHSVDDTLIPISNAVRLFDSIPHKFKHFVAIKGDHATPLITTQQLREIFDFCMVDTTNCLQMQDLLNELRTLGKRPCFYPENQCPEFSPDLSSNSSTDLSSNSSPDLSSNSSPYLSSKSSTDLSSQEKLDPNSLNNIHSIKENLKKKCNSIKPNIQSRMKDCQKEQKIKKKKKSPIEKNRLNESVIERMKDNDNNSTISKYSSGYLYSLFENHNK